MSKKSSGGLMKRFSGAIIQPILYLSVIGILIAFGVLLNLSFMPSFIKAIGSFLEVVVMQAGITNLSVIICVGLTAVFAKKKKSDAAIVGLISFLVYLYANNLFLTNTGMLIDPESVGGTLTGTGQGTVLGIQVDDAGVFMGIILGCLNGWIFNKTCDKQLPDALRIYGGTRWSCFMIILMDIALAIVMAYIWPVLDAGINALTTFIRASGYVGLFVYGFLNRFLIPTGLHHLVYMPFMYTSIGGTATIAGQDYSGAYNIWLAELTNAGSITSIDGSIQYMFFGFSKIWGTIGTVLAFIHTARPERKAQTRALLIPPAMVAILAGITEPLEFLYLFASPVLWLVHSLLDGLFQTLCYVFGFASSQYSGIIDTVVGFIAFPALSHWWVWIILGLIGTAAWYFAFVFLINKLNLQTPGREEIEGSAIAAVKKAQTQKAAAKQTNFADEETEEGKTGSNDMLKSVRELGDPDDIIEGLGGADNIEDLENCFTRLRVTLKDMSKLDEAAINKFKNSGIVKKNDSVQIIIGLRVDDVCAAINERLHRNSE